MAWFKHTVNSFLGFPTHSFHYKTMAFGQSCFPCSLHVILRNMFPGAISEDDRIENLWNEFQQGNLDQIPPDELQVHAYLARTPEVLNRINRIKFISPTSFKSNIGQQTFHAHLSQFLEPRYRAMVFGIRHATVVFKMENNTFVHFNPDTELKNCKIRSSRSFILGYLGNNPQNKVEMIKFRGDGDFGDNGTFILMMG